MKNEIVFLRMTVKTKLKLDDWFKTYGPAKYTHLAAHWRQPSCVHHPACTILPYQIVVPVWVYGIFNSSGIMFSILHHHASQHIYDDKGIIKMYLQP